MTELIRKDVTYKSKSNNSLGQHREVWSKYKIGRRNMDMYTCIGNRGVSKLLQSIYVPIMELGFKVNCIILLELEYSFRTRS